MRQLSIHISAIILSLISFHMSAYAQSNSQIQELEAKVDSTEGYQKAVLLLQIANLYENISLSQSLVYCHQAMECFPQFTGQDNFLPGSGVFNEPDSILDLRAKMYNTLGKCYYNLNEDNNFETNGLSNSSRANKEHALENFGTMLKIRMHQGKAVPIAKAYNAVAVSLMGLGNADSAMKIFNLNLIVFQQNNLKSELAKTYNNMAYINALDSTKREKAVNLFRVALRFAEEDSLADVYITASLNLADDCVKRRNYTMASQYLFNAIPACQKTHNHLYLKVIYHEMADIFNKQKKYEQAFEYMSKYVELKDSLINEETMMQINELAAKYENKLRQNEISELKHNKADTEIKMEEQRIWITIFIIVSILALGALALAAIEYKRKNKSNNLLSKANENINNSLTYASRLQKIIITGERKASAILKDYFVLHRPRNIVSGDFYYVRDFENYKVVAVADCTGHGVPAAFLSVLNITFFDEIFRANPSAPDPGNVLDKVRYMVKNALQQTSDLSSSTDGMDCGLVIVDKESHTAKYAGGYIDLYILRSSIGKIDVVRSTHNPVCWYFKEIPFKTQEITLAANDVIYMFSDGYPDQVNPNADKYTKTRLRKKLEEMSQCNLPTQKELLIKNMEQWQQNAEQIDDILILGIRTASLFH